MSDGSGSAEDPNGLPMPELLRLFHAGLPLGAMRTSELSPSGIMTMADTAEVGLGVCGAALCPSPP
eukprot:scaffold29279_cov51-Isochrysis_galbana.AAC.1